MLISDACSSQLSRPALARDFKGTIRRSTLGQSQMCRVAAACSKVAVPCQIARHFGRDRLSVSEFLYAGSLLAFFLFPFFFEVLTHCALFSRVIICLPLVVKTAWPQNEMKRDFLCVYSTVQVHVPRFRDERSCLTPFFSQGRNVQTYVFSLNKEKRGQFGSKHWIRLLNQRRLSNFLGGHRESLKRRASRNTLSVKITLVYLNKKNIDSGRNKELFHLYGKLEKKIASQFLPGPWGTAPASQLPPPYPYWFNYIIYIV